MRDAGCGSCHTIPGVEGADGRSAPPLTHWKSRAWIAGRLENRPGELVRWLRDPQAVDPETAMPDLDLTEAEAQAVASVLLSIR
jgi:cytochrome c1